MRISLSLAVLCALLPAGLASAQSRVQSREGIAVTGNVSGSTLIVGTPAAKLKEIVAASNREWRNLTDSQRGELGSLQRQLGVTDGTLKTFFAVLGERNVSEEQLAAKLGEIAGRYKDLQQGVTTIPASSPEIAALRGQAEAALDAGRFEEADRLLARMQELQRSNLAGQLADLSATAARRGAATWR